MMHEKIFKQHKYLFPFILFAGLFLSIIPDSHSQRNEKCSQAFQCGGIPNISYPFWGSNRPEICGFPGFQLLNCQGDAPLLNIDSTSYRVLEIDFVTQSLRIARLDLWNTTCPSVLQNTTLDPKLFESPSVDSYENVTLYYDCKNDQFQAINLRNQFNCEVDGAKTVNLFAPGESSERGSHIICSNNISVPVNLSAARALSAPSASIDNLRDALTSGFSVQWLEKITNCESCVESGRVCGYDPDSLSIRCNNSQSMVVGGARPPNPSTPTPTRITLASLPNPSTPSPTYITMASPPKSSTPALTYITLASPPNPSTPAPTYITLASPPNPRTPAPTQITRASPPNPSTLAPKVSPGLVPDRSPGPSLFYHTETRVGKSGMSTVEKFLIGMAIVVAVIVAAAFTIICLRRRRRFTILRNGLNQQTNPNVENFLFNNESMAPRRYKYSQIKKITKSFSDKLGQGGYGSVYKGTLPDEQFVAVKLLTETKSNGEDFINEVASISKTSHVNIVNLLGYCYERNRRALVYEYMPNKSLDKFISTGRSVDTNKQLDWETLFNIAVGVARGLEYLHKGCNTRIIHFDIKPQNILLDEEFCPKISDFGLAKLCKKKQSILSIPGTRGTVGYIAPEVFSRNFGGVSHKSDVYSYGMMVLEMAGARNIAAGARSTQSSENCFPDKIYEHEILQENKNLNDMESEEVDEATRKMFLVGFWCIQTVPSDRPSMSKVVDMLEGSLQSIQIPPKPYLFNPPMLGQGFSSASGNVEIEISIED